MKRLLLRFLFSRHEKVIIINSLYLQRDRINKKSESEKNEYDKQYYIMCGHLINILG